MAASNEAPEPIVVRKSPFKEISESALRAALMAAFAIAAGQFIRSDIVMGTVTPLLISVAGFVATWLFALQKLLKDHWQRRHMARMLPDDVATVKGDHAQPPA